MRRFTLLSTLLLCLFTTRTTQALDVTIDFNGFLATSGVFVNGTGGFSDIIFSSPGATRTYTGLVANGIYNIDLLHNPAADSPDFRFTINSDGTGIASVTTSNYGTGPHTMVTGFSPGDTTLTLNTHSVTYNANGANTGAYYGPGGIPYAQTGPHTYTAIPGGQTIDNLYNSGAGNEDFTYSVDSSGNVFAPAGNGGGPTGIPNSEYATFSGNQVEVRAEMVRYVLNANTPLNMLFDQTPLNSTGWIPVLGGYQLEFDVLMPIGGSGVNVWSFGDFIVNASNAALPNGASLQGVSGPNDFLFRPTLRYDGTSNGTGFYWLGPGPGLENIVTAEVTGFLDGGQITPLSLTISAILPEFIPPPPPAPEPASLALLSLGLVGLAARRRRRS